MFHILLKHLNTDKLILNKSRENFAKYLIINEFGGLFININIIKSLNPKQINFINNIHIIARITADCTFTDPFLIKEMLDEFVKSDFEYLANTTKEDKKAKEEANNVPFNFGRNWKN